MFEGGVYFPSILTSAHCFTAHLPCSFSHSLLNVFCRCHILQRKTAPKVRLLTSTDQEFRPLENGSGSQSGLVPSSVMDFREVLAKSMCRPMEQLVDVEREFPEDVEHLYIPACVPLWRCSGCCGDENLECQPTLERNVTLQVWRGPRSPGRLKHQVFPPLMLSSAPQVVKILPLRSKHSAEISFVEHQKCECR
uniref:Platelet-derived growth factor (PDGF) family profile domain-containing protein n=1 Tax=Salarias fasciatus TaxID=181472 RepID=A0A672JHM3_SALFA